MIRKVIRNLSLEKKIEIVLFTLIAVRVMFLILNLDFGMYFFAFGISQPALNLCLNLLIVLAGTLLMNVKEKSGWKYLLDLFPIILAMIIIFSYLLIHGGKRYFSFKSPKGTHTLVAVEDSFLLEGWCNFYKGEALIFIEPLRAQITTDDGYGPFSADHYRLKWTDETTVELEYDFGTGKGDYRKAIIRVE